MLSLGRATYGTENMLKSRNRCFNPSSLSRITSLRYLLMHWKGKQLRFSDWCFTPRKIIHTCLIDDFELKVSWSPETKNRKKRRRWRFDLRLKCCDSSALNQVLSVSSESESRVETRSGPARPGSDPAWAQITLLTPHMSYVHSGTSFSCQGTGLVFSRKY